MKLLIIYAWHICINKTVYLSDMSAFRPHFLKNGGKVSSNTHTELKTMQS